MPKGILIVNAFKDIPLTERNEDPFPHQMLDYSTKRGHCLMTTLQLLGLFFDCSNNPENKASIIEDVFNSNGIFRNFTDWKKYISESEK